MAPLSFDRRLLLSAFLVPFDGLVSVAPATAQSGTSLPPIIQPAEKTEHSLTHAEQLEVLSGLFQAFDEHSLDARVSVSRGT